ncbi:class I SAM-dependent methyltransferase [Photorhabdus australis]|uniref:class I SAM-dependent methyltransferase n=1 Tax=Photorhabdus australis TaxID=286156 RepID=UPI00068D290E|nr:class I SAM-dependent methyltransferase [Photorhabdus australis]
MNNLEDTEKYYDDLANNYDYFYNDNISLAEDEIIKDIISKLVIPFSKVLDCGCGTGLARYLMKDIPCQYTGIDISKNMLEIAKNKYPECHFIHGDCSNMPYINDNSVDNIISLNGVFSHIINYKDAIHEMWRTLKPGGNLFIMVYSRFAMKRLLSGKAFSIKSGYDIRNNIKKIKSCSPAVFWSLKSLKKEFNCFNEIEIFGLNILASILKKQSPIEDVISFLRMERRLPLFVQQFSHALILQAKK